MATIRAQHPKHPSRPDEIRCGCSRLLARRVPGGLELQCGRCKARAVVALTADSEPKESEITLVKRA